MFCGEINILVCWLNCNLLTFEHSACVSENMSGKRSENEQSSSAWDIPGPSSLAAILDTVNTSEAMETPQRNGSTIITIFLTKRVNV